MDAMNDYVFALRREVSFFRASFPLWKPLRISPRNLLNLSSVGIPCSLLPKWLHGTEELGGPQHVEAALAVETWLL